MRKIAVVFLVLMACGVETDDHPERPSGGGGFLPGANDSTDDVHCAPVWNEIIHVAVCWKTTPGGCPSGNLQFLASMGQITGIPGASVACFCPSGNTNSFGQCMPQAVTPDYTSCSDDRWMKLTSGICGIVPDPFWQGAGAPPKWFKSDLTDPTLVYLSADITTDNSTAVIVDTASNHLTVVSADLSCSFDDDFLGMTEQGMSSCIPISAAPFSVIPAPSATTSYFKLGWDETP